MDSFYIFLSKHLSQNIRITQFEPSLCHSVIHIYIQLSTTKLIFIENMSFVKFFDKEINIE